MPNKRNIMIPPQGGMVRDFWLRFRLILRLIRDPRVHWWLKILPIAGVAYIFSPIGVISDLTLPIIGELDEVAVLWLTNFVFIELCPPEVVNEHAKALGSGKRGSEEDDVVDAETIEIKDRRK